MRSKPASSMQKTYDECYLTCSTAVYFEGQNNELEALRSWKSALDTLNYHNAYRVPPTYVPKTENERTLQISLRELELQCRERVDLLEALRESRKEAAPESNHNGGGGNHYTNSREEAPHYPRIGQLETGSVQVGNEEFPEPEPGWLGNGTVPSMNYAQLSRPTPPPPPVPSRPPPPRPSTEYTAHPSHEFPTSTTTTTAALPSSPALPAYSASSPQRGPSPDRKPMLTTLRSREPKKPSSTPATLLGPRKPSRPAAASRAAGLAWSSIARLSGGGASSAPAASSSGNTASPSRKAVSRDQEARRDNESRQYTGVAESPRQMRTSYLSDYFGSGGGGGRHRSHSADEQPSSSLAAGAAAAAIAKPTSDIEPLIDLSDPSPPSSYDMRNAKPSRPTPRPSFTAPKTPDYLTSPDEYTGAKLTPTTSYSSTRRNRGYSNGRPQFNKSNSESGQGSYLASSISATSQSKAQGPSRTPVPGPSNGIDEALNYAFQSMYTGAGVGDSAVKMGKRPDGQAVRTTPPPSTHSSLDENTASDAERDRSVRDIMKNLPKGVDPATAQEILNEIVIRGDEVHWDDVAGLEPAKKALKEAVVYPFLRPDLFMGLREPARGMLLFGPPGTGKTMLARAVATESKSTFFSVSASSLTSKWHGESEKLVRALFALAKAMAPSIIFVDEIDSLLSSRSSASENEASRRTKTEFLIQWSDLQRAAAGREQSDKEKREGDPTRVLVLAATNMPWDIDEAARRRFVRRQYIPLPEAEVRKLQLENLLSHQKQELDGRDIEELVTLTDGFSGSDITALAKDAAMGPLRNLGEALLHTPMDQIRPIRFPDFEASLSSIRPSVSRDGLKEYESWAKEFGERGG
ncbi:hypothetical protein AJ80_01705 [Polytolypa hystricis UAMH7299]|uniref:AAA+ ATPase domain-containing protein n=1 Tax=Polytolypa hystricis (strain UAMH7299) TaxID=1447883 RepID=A0A2B7YY23_POLH7|nr:hypothetical protein AJ80_01705 [Polytolypa hystricis UAMH7299]